MEVWKKKKKKKKKLRDTITMKRKILSAVSKLRT